MFPVVSIVGESKSGKTTLLESLIGELRSRGHQLAAIKHTHSDFEMDQPGKDSWRLREAGCDTVVLSSPKKMAVFAEREDEANLEELFSLIKGDIDLVLTEGFKRANTPKIEVHRKGGGPLVCPVEQLLAIVTEEKLDNAVPQYSPQDVGALADLIERSVLASPGQDRLAVEVNGSLLPLNSFVSRLYGNTLAGMVSTLNKGDRINNVHVWLRRGKD
jgi:molybdopterin-guanine dinucleotide biosynthesis protein B